MSRRIYLDNNATTALDSRVVEAMLPHLGQIPQNPSSVHAYGQLARKQLVQARQQIASYFGLSPREIIFTSGGTESLNAVLQGLCRLHKKGHIVTSNLEHSAVFETIQNLQNEGFEATYIAPGQFGAATVEDVKDAVRPDTLAICLMSVNNETGVMTDIEAIAAFAAEKNIPFIVDGVAHLGKEALSLPRGLSAIAFSGHKVHGPKGSGLLCLRSSLPIAPLLIGGGQEGGRRSGTENLAAIIGLAKAIDLLRQELPEACARMQHLRDWFEQKLQIRCGSVAINGLGPRVCNVSNVYIDGVDGETLLINLDQAGVCISHGSACASGGLEPSRILLNMGYSRQRARSSIRLSLSRMTTKEEVEQAVEIIAACVAKSFA